MLYLYGAFIACMIVLGQVLWKFGVEKSGFTLSRDFLQSAAVWRFVFSPYVIVGLAAYGLATVLYMSLLAKNDYTSLQAIVVSSSLLATFLAAALIFHEKISFMNLIGVACLIVGVILITRY